MIPVAEDELLQAVMDALELRRATSRDTVAQHIRRADLGLLMGQAGLPDVLGVVGGTLIAWELKDDRGRVDQAQAEWIHRLRNVHTVDVRILRPADQDGVVAELLRDRLVGDPRAVRQLHRPEQ